MVVGAALAALAGCLAAPGQDPGPPASIQVSPPWTALGPGDTVRLSATGPGPVTWSSADPAVAQVDPSGLVTGRAHGHALIAAAAGPGSALAAVVVAPPVLVGAGDIADCNHDGDAATARLLDSLPGVAFTAGDNAYPNGTAANFTQCYEPTWGRHKPRTRPAPGNHDYRTAQGAPYYAYFGDLAGEPGRGYYSYDFAGWHMISLNSNIPMAAGSPQDAWLRADLAAHPAPCTIAYWHHPRFSSGEHGNNAVSEGAWRALYAAGADLVVSGHDHTYERFAPQTPDAAADPARGIRQFVAGSGGAGFYDFTTIRAHSEVRNNTTHGVLRLTLLANGYEWEFIATDGSVKDSGSGTCH